MVTEIQPEKRREICAQIDSIEMSLFEGMESEFLQETYYVQRQIWIYGGLYKYSKDWHVSNSRHKDCTYCRYKLPGIFHF